MSLTFPLMIVKRIATLPDQKRRCERVRHLREIVRLTGNENGHGVRRSVLKPFVNSKIRELFAD